MAACLHDQTGDDGHGRVTSMALIGHSYAKCMADVMEQDQMWFNLGLNNGGSVAEVRSYHRDGATMRMMRDDRWIHLQ
jgi:hypothetical protein